MIKGKIAGLKMRKWLYCAILLSALGMGDCFAQKKRSKSAASREEPESTVQIMDGIAAIVNGSVVTISQLRELVGAREQSLHELYKGRELETKILELRKAALQDLIDRQLVLQEFGKLADKGAKIPDYVVDDRITSIIREEFGGDRAAFVRTLQAQGYTLSRFRSIEKDKITVQALRQSKFNDQLMISPAQIQNFYNNNKQKYTAADQVKLRMIVVRAPSPEEEFMRVDKRQVAADILKKLHEGAEFARMAQLYTEDPGTQENGGDWGWVDRKTLTPRLTQVAFSLAPKKMSGLVTIEGNHYILYAEDRKYAGLRPLADVREDVQAELMQQERVKEQERWLEGLRRKAFIKILL